MKRASEGKHARPSSDFILHTSYFLCGALVLYCSPAIVRADEFSQVSHYSARLFSYETLVVDTRVGNLRIEGWDEPRVEIEAEKVVRTKSEATARPLFEQIRIELEGGDRDVRLRTVYPPRRLWRPLKGASRLSVNFRIRMPYDSNLKLKCTDGDVRVRSLVGHEELKVTYGDVEITVPSAFRLRSLNARTFLGYVQSDLHGEDDAGFGRKILFWNPSGDQDIEIRVRLGGVYVYQGQE